MNTYMRTFAYTRTVECLKAKMYAICTCDIDESLGILSEIIHMKKLILHDLFYIKLINRVN